MPIKEKFSIRVQRAVLAITPFFLALVMFAFSVGAVKSSAFASVRPEVLIICVYYWALFYPLLMPYPAVMLLGLVEDSITGNLFGLSAFLLVLVKYLSTRWLKGYLRKGFSRIWMGAALILSLAAVIRFTVQVAIMQVVPELTQPLLQLTFSILLYPPVHVLLSYIHGIIIRR